MNGGADVEDVLVVGAGPAGLAVAHELVRAGRHPRVVDAADRVAEPWRRRHDMLHLNTHRRFSALPGLRFPRTAGAFPHRDDVVRYLEEYARVLPVDIGWDVALHRADPERSCWRAETSAGELRARHLVIATGPDRVPVRPHWPGEADFRGEIRHAAEIHRPGDLAGRRVLIVGGGNSGIDLASALSRISGSRYRLSVRHGVTVVPRRLGRVPLHPLAVASRHAPVWWQDASARVLSRIACGDLTRLGYPRPERGAMTTFLGSGISPATDDGFVAALRRGDTEVVAEVARFEPDGVVLVDGRRLAVDTVVCATGYRTGLEPVVGHLGVLDDLARPLAVPGPVPGQPGLWFAGLRPPFHGNLYGRRAEARTIASGIAGDRRGEARRASPAGRSGVT